MSIDTCVPSTAIEPDRHVEPAARRPLHGRRIGLATSIVGFGGSEVLIADVIEAVWRGGAEVVCWCHPEAAVRRIVHERHCSRSVVFRNWPESSGTLDPASNSGTPPHQPIYGVLRNIYRRIAPMGLKRYAGFVRDASRFQRELSRHSLDALLVNVNGSEAAAVAGGQWSKARTITCYHLSFTEPEGSWLDRSIDRIMCHRSMHAAGCIVHPSLGARNQWCRQLGVPLERTRVIYNGVDDRPVRDPGAVRESLGIPPGTFVFCVPGRLDPIKGHAYLLGAMAHSATGLGDSVVLICGDGPLSDQLKQRAIELRVANLVRFLGFRDDLPDILAASDCTVLPSMSENLSVAILESLTVGTPAIVTNVGGMAEAVIDGVSGMVVPRADPRALANAMTAMVSDRQRTAQMGRVARQDALVRFSRRRMMDEYVALFSHVISSTTT